MSRRRSSPAPRSSSRWTPEEETALRSALLRREPTSPQAWDDVAATLQASGFGLRTGAALSQRWKAMHARGTKPASGSVAQRPPAIVVPRDDPARSSPTLGMSHAMRRVAPALALFLAMVLPSAIPALASDALTRVAWVWTADPPPRSPRAPPARAPSATAPTWTAPTPDDDDEILCDCGWTRWPGQSCEETRSATGFPCWKDCCIEPR
jgi:hypothetical protein